MSDIATRIRDYINSRVFIDLPDQSLSEYWSHYHGGITTKFEPDRVKVAGGSGLYEPRARRGLLAKIGSFASNPKSYGRIVAQQLVRKSMRRLGMLDEFVALPGDAAFDAVHLHSDVADIDISPYRIDFRKIARASGNYATSDAVKVDFKHSGVPADPTGHIFLTYYYYNILNYMSAFDRGGGFLEIGAGNGNLARLLLKRRQNKSYIVDLPRTLTGSIEFLTRTRPDLRVVLPHEAHAGTADADLVFLTPAQIDLIPDQSVTLAVNVASFQEMKPSQVARYFDLIERAAAPEAVFLSVNRIEKIPGGPEASTTGTRESVMRAAEYPWRGSWEVLAREVCRLNRLMSRDNCELRLCRIGSHTVS